MCAEDFSVSRRTSSGVDFVVCSDSVFVKDLCFCSSLCALKISASAVELVPVLISGCAATQFSSMISDSAAVYAPRRFHCQLLSWFPVMISGSTAT